MTGRVFQLIPVLEPDDAIGDHAHRIATILGERHGGFIVERAAPSLRHLATVWTEAEVDPGDVLLYHVALASRLGEWMQRTRARKVIDYHNITPPEFFRAYEPGLAAALANATHELEDLKGQVALALADSEYSRRELEERGFSRTETLPILIDFGRYDLPGNRELADRLSAGKRGRGDIIFVGRIAPNKRYEDLIKVFTIYRRAYNPAARLFLIGGTNSAVYSRTLDSFVQRLGIEGVHFTGRIAAEDLVAYYRTADLFLSMSEHEGFGVPWLEAMYFGVPVVSLAAAAIPETVGDAAVLFREKNHDEVAALVDLVMRDEELRADLADAGRRRLREFRPERHEARLRQWIDEIP